MRNMPDKLSIHVDLNRSELDKLLINNYLEVMEGLGDDDEDAVNFANKAILVCGMSLWQAVPDLDKKKLARAMKKIKEILES